MDDIVMLAATMSGGKRPYWKKVRGTAPIACWPLWDTSGVIAEDISGNSRNAAYRNTDGVLNGVTLDQPGFAGVPSALFDGAAGFVNLYSVSLRDAFNGAAGSAMIWVKPAAGLWTDGDSRYFLNFRADTNNFVRIQRSGAHNGRLDFAVRAGGSTTLVKSFTSQSSYDWTCYVGTWSRADDQVRGYVNGVEFGDPLAGHGVWAGTIMTTATYFGNYDSGLTFPLFSGHGAFVTVWDRALTPGDVASLYRV